MRCHSPRAPTARAPTTTLPTASWCKRSRRAVTGRRDRAINGQVLSSVIVLFSLSDPSQNSDSGSGTPGALLREVPERKSDELIANESSSIVACLLSVVQGFSSTTATGSRIGARDAAGSPPTQCAIDANRRGTTRWTMRCARTRADRTEPDVTMR